MKEKAIRLRKEGLSLNAISERLSKSKTTVWYWIKDIPQPEQFTATFKQKLKEEHLECIFKQRQIKRKEREKEKERERLLKGENTNKVFLLSKPSNIYTTKRKMGENTSG